MQCPSCNNEVLPGEPFCDNCGAALEAAPPPEATTSANQTIAPAIDAAPGADQTMVPPPAPVGPAVVPPIDINATPAVAVAPPPLPPGPSVAKIVIDSDGTLFALTPGQSAIVGREDPIDGIYPEIDLTPYDEDVGVSRRHAELHEQGGQWFVKDLGSTNYTVVNRQRAQPDQDMLLQDGDEIRFSRVMAHFQMD